jgi:DHA3 family macrolide efflux protein-like MFS transporter
MTDQGPRRFHIWTITGGESVLKEPRFRRLWELHILGQMGQYAINYSLLILVVGSSASSIRAGLFILAYTIPSALLGPLSGVIVDRLSRSFILAATNTGRALLCLGLLASSGGLAAIYLFALAFASLSQLNTPATSAVLPEVVTQEELTRANSLINLGGLLAEAVGIVVLAALLLRTVGSGPLFVVLAGIFGGAAFLAATIRGVSARAGAADLKRAVTSGFRESFARAWQRLRHDMPSYMALIINVVATGALLIGVALLPRYAKEELGVSTENIVFIFAPAAIGIFAGLRGVNWLSHMIGKSRAQVLGFIVLVLSLVSFGLTTQEASAFAHLNLFGVAHPGPLHGKGARVLVAMITAVFGGFGSSLTSVASRAIMNERIPLEMQGRVFAAQNVLANLASAIPVLVASAFAEAIGPRPVIVGTAIVMTALVVWAFLRSRTLGAPVGGVYA